MFTSVKLQKKSTIIKIAIVPKYSHNTYEYEKIVSHRDTIFTELMEQKDIILLSQDTRLRHIPY